MRLSYFIQQGLAEVEKWFPCMLSPKLLSIPVPQGHIFHDMDETHLKGAFFLLYLKRCCLQFIEPLAEKAH